MQYAPKPCDVFSRLRRTAFAWIPALGERTCHMRTHAAGMMHAFTRAYRPLTPRLSAYVEQRLSLHARAYTRPWQTSALSVHGCQVRQGARGCILLLQAHLLLLQVVLRLETIPVNVICACAPHAKQSARSKTVTCSRKTRGTRQPRGRGVIGTRVAERMPAAW